MLDFSQVATQIKSFASDRARELPQFQTALTEASRRLTDSGPTWEATHAKINRSRTSWLLADWLEPPDRAYAPPPRPTPCAVLAADGSQIVSDRHDITLCVLLNIGLVALRYGTGERAYLASRPTLSFPDEELLDEFQGEQGAVLPRRLGVRRLLAELDGLAGLIAQCAPQPDAANAPADLFSFPEAEMPTLALSDGSLILWPLETEQEPFRGKALQAFQASLEVARQRRVPIAGYISQPRSRDVLNALRVFRCPYPHADCDHYCPHRHKLKPEFKPPDCAGTERIADADLFAQLLEPGERSAVFGSQSKILKSYDPAHRVRFFYLHTGREVARVEIPAWVAEDQELMERTHALCYDQARKGDGYPVGLVEAHEQATVRGAERDAFFRLMEREFVGERVPVALTQKAVSKRARRI